jgi:hypothetical protein
MVVKDGFNFPDWTPVFSDDIDLRKSWSEIFQVGAHDALNLAPHFHSIVMDGVCAADSEGQSQFHELPAPDTPDVLRVAPLVAERVESRLRRRGLHPDDNPEDQLFIAKLAALVPRLAPI